MDKSAQGLSLKIEGGKKLSGTVTTNSSKNGAVVLLCASLLNKNTTRLKNMPHIEEVNRLIEVLRSIGVKVSWKGRDVIIKPPPRINLNNINESAARKTRSIILFLGPLIHHFKKFKLPQSGGCKLGSRTIRPHLYALENLGVKIEIKEKYFAVSSKRFMKDKTIILYEPGDTATENAIMTAAKIPGETTIKYASANYQVQDLCFFLEEAGVKIDGVGTTTLVVHGVQEIDIPLTYYVSEDPTDSMLFLTAAIMTHSSITIKRCPIDFLEMELLVLSKMGFKYEITKHYLSYNKKTKLVDIKTKPSTLTAPYDKIHARPYPALNTDNLPFFAVIATRAKGQTLIHDWMYEKRAIYYTELDKLGADTLLADPHRFFVTGPTTLHATELVCPPALRPAAIILIAMLGASGTSILRNIYTIERGYEDLARRLKTIGAHITILK